MILVTLALAHELGVSYAEVERASLTLTLAREELAERVPMGDLDAARVLVAGATIHRARVEAGGAPCAIGEPTVRAVEGDGVEVAATLDCPDGERVFAADYLDDLRAGHTTLVSSGGRARGTVRVGAPTLALGHPPARAEVAWRFLRLGVEHIWTGYDHLAFLAALLLVATKLRDMLLIVTGFTIAHSLTLTAAALGVLELPGAVVEPAIAASIAWVGFENLWTPSPRRRLVATFLLGLIHGFGFAGLLADLGLPRDDLLVALVSFNGGVELGQAAIVAALLPLLVALRRSDGWTRRAVPVLSVGIALAGVWWFVERVFGA